MKCEYLRNAASYLIKLSGLILFGLLGPIACGAHDVSDNLTMDASSGYVLSLSSLEYEYSFATSDTTRPRISFSYSPLENFSYQSFYLPTKVKPFKTQWAMPWDRKSIVIEMDRILYENNVSSLNARVRMIAHAIVASGWRQNVWNYNAWGVRQGSWEGSWYEMPTEEVDDNGNYYTVSDAAWRSFSDWTEAIQDFNARINPLSGRPSYRQAYRHLTALSSHYKVDAAYWEALGSGNYYTATQFTGKKFAMLCNTVRQLINEAEIPL